MDNLQRPLLHVSRARPPRRGRPGRPRLFVNPCFFTDERGVVRPLRKTYRGRKCGDPYHPVLGGDLTMQEYVDRLLGRRR